MLGIFSAVVPISLGLLFSFTGTALIARMVGPAVFGEYMYLLTWISIAALLSKAGHEWVLLKIIPGRQKTGEFGQIKFLVLKAFKSVMHRASAAVLILAGLSALSDYKSEPGILAVGLALVPVIALAELRRSWALAHHAVWLSDAPENIIKSIAIVGAITVYLAWGFEVKVVTLLIFNVFITVVTATVASFLLVKKTLPGFIKYPTQPLPGNMADTKDFARSMWISTVLNISVRNMDLIIIGLMSDAITTGLYAAASRIGQLSAAPVMVLDKLVTPILAIAVEENDSKKLMLTSQRFVWMASIGAASILSAFFLVGNDVTNLIFGESYISSHLMVLIILMGNTGVALAGPANVVMSLSGAHRESLVITTIAAILNILLIIIMTYFFGAAGTATAVAVAASAKAWLSAIWVRIFMSFDITIFGLFKK